MVFGAFYADFQGFTRRLRSLARCRLPQRHRVHCGGIAATMSQAPQLHAVWPERAGARSRGDALALLQVQRVTGEHLLRADLARQDFLMLRELDHGFYGLTVARQAVGERVLSHQAAALCQGLGLVG